MKPKTTKHTHRDIGTGKFAPNITPGPWDLVYRQYHIFVESLATGYANVATVSEGNCRGEQVANARLIAAAPDLLKAVLKNHQWHKDGYDEGYEGSELENINLTAIAKAGGNLK